MGEATLAEVIVYGREMLTEEMAVRERVQEKSQLRQAEREMQELRQQVQELERLAQGQGGEITEQQLLKDLQAVRANVANATLLSTLYGQALLAIKERDQEIRHLTTQIEKQYERRMAKQQTRIQELEAEQAAWTAWKETQVSGQNALSVMRHYLQDHLKASIPIKRNGVTVKILAMGQDAVAVSENHGMIRLSDEELELGRVWVCKKVGLPLVATCLPLGSRSQEQIESIEAGEMTASTALLKKHALQLYFLQGNRKEAFWTLPLQRGETLYQIRFLFEEQRRATAKIPGEQASLHTLELTEEELEALRAKAYQLLIKG